MRGFIALSLLVLAACGGGGADSGPDAPAADAGADGRTGPAHLQYYGYYRDGGLLGEIADHANLTFIGPGSAEDGVPTAVTLADAESRGLRGMLDLQSVFGIHADGSMRPTEEWQQKWNAYSTNLAPFVQRGAVAGFYMFDEPDPAATPAFWTSLEFAASVVRERFPGVPIVLGYGWWNLYYDGLLVVPSGFDWFGFNCYGPFETCMSADGTGPSVQALFDRLESRLAPGQRIVLIPEASNFFNIAFDQPYDETDYTSRLDRYMALATSRPSVVAVVPFFWTGQFGPTPNPEEKGLRDMSAPTREAFAAVGRAIAGP